MLTRKNTITGIEYRDDPIIFGWELINEPRCMSDPTGDTLHVSTFKFLDSHEPCFENSFLVDVEPSCFCLMNQDSRFGLHEIMLN